MNIIIRNAIGSKKVIEFYYDGGARIAEPFCYGINRKNNEVLCAYQIGGYSSSGNPEGWKLFKVSEISSLKVTDIVFDGDRKEYNPNDKRMTEIFCNV
jgi:hypothetical protein